VAARRELGDVQTEVDPDWILDIRSPLVTVRVAHSADVGAGELVSQDCLCSSCPGPWYAHGHRGPIRSEACTESPVGIDARRRSGAVRRATGLSS
jgi:hypothetical protein